MMVGYVSFASSMNETKYIRVRNETNTMLEIRAGESHRDSNLGVRTYKDGSSWGREITETKNWNDIIVFLMPQENLRPGELEAAKGMLRPGQSKDFIVYVDPDEPREFAYVLSHRTIDPQDFKNTGEEIAIRFYFKNPPATITIKNAVGRNNDDRNYHFSSPVRVFQNRY